MNDDIERVQELLRRIVTDKSQPYPPLLRSEASNALYDIREYRDRLEAELKDYRSEAAQIAAEQEVERLREKLRDMWWKVTRLRRIEEAARVLSDRVLGMTSVIYVPLREEAEALRNALAEEKA